MSNIWSSRVTGKKKELNYFTIMAEDPYRLLTESIKLLNEPVNKLLESHKELLSNHLDSLNNLKEIDNFNLVLSNKVNHRDLKNNFIGSSR